jgi:2Fe-2S ferredoxin
MDLEREIMAGVNPYIEKPDAKPAQKPFRITYIIEESNETRVVDVDPAKLPYDRTGLPGSILEIALGHDIEIDHSCGGVCACSTCHVIVREGLESCPEATDDEQDMLDTARGLEMESRLACQCVPNGSRDLVVVVPAWNKNLAKEGH